jgi:carbonic anhydrase/acetyltransferase-like protein (isoleucine patch superfamily)
MIYSFQGKSPKIHPTAYIAPGAQIIGDVVIEENASVWFNAVLRGDNDQIRIGKGSNIQDGSIVHTDHGFPVNVEENVTVGHNVILHGCTVKSGSLIGMGATILNGAVIGEGSLIAAGALVLEGRTIPPGSLAAGSPAKVIREVSPENAEALRQGAVHYQEKAAQYKKEHIY